MKVFVLLERIDYEGDNLIEVFSSEEKLIDYVKKSYTTEYEVKCIYKTDYYGDTLLCRKNHLHNCNCDKRYVMIEKELL